MVLPPLTPEYVELIKHGIAFFFATVLLLFVLSLLKSIWESYKKKSDKDDDNAVTKETIQGKIDNLTKQVDEHVLDMKSYKESTKDCIVNLKNATEKATEVSKDTNKHMEKLCDSMKDLSETQCVVAENVKNIMTIFADMVKRRDAGQ